MSSRPSPIQVSYLGFPGTLGTKFIDYLIMDNYIINSSNRKFFSENINKNDSNKIDKEKEFHNKMKIGGKGWNKISKVPAELTAGIYEWILVMALLLCILLGTGKLLFHEWIMGGVLIGAAAILFLPFLKVLSRARAS